MPMSYKKYVDEFENIVVKDCISDLHDRFARLQRELHCIGVTVNNIKVIEHPKNYYATSVFDTRQDINKYDCHFTISMNYDQASAYVYNKQELEELGRKYDQVTQQLRSAERIVNKNKKFHNFVKQDPQLNEMYNEMLTMMKLMGFDEKE